MKNTIEKKLKDLKNKSKLNSVETKKILDELVSIAAMIDRNENTSEILKPYSGRFDKYFASFASKWHNTISLYIKETDEYFMISKDRECVSLTKLVNNYNRLSLSDWLHRFGIYFLDAEIGLMKDLRWGFQPNDDTFHIVAMLFMQGMDILENKGIDMNTTYLYYEELSETGDYENLIDFDLNKKYTEISEMHMLMSDLNDYLLKYPFEINGNPFDIKEKSLLIKIDDKMCLDVYGAYLNMKPLLNDHPLITFYNIEKYNNEYIIDKFNKMMLQIEEV